MLFPLTFRTLRLRQFFSSVGSIPAGMLEQEIQYLSAGDRSRLEQLGLGGGAEEKKTGWSKTAGQNAAVLLRREWTSDKNAVVSSRRKVQVNPIITAPTKSPGVDGFPALFYQHNWSLVGDQLCAEVLRYLNEGVQDKRLNITRVALVPKCKSPRKIEEFRPISVCNTPMKVISKVLANRLQGLLNQVISHSQSAFIRGRLITDNVLIAHEISHFIKNRKCGQDEVLSLKLDMSKTYDRIERMLRKYGFPDVWIGLVMNIVT
ncbi:hypothetical protein QQ045_032529 [Rhodiola kirilowii]